MTDLGQQLPAVPKTFTVTAKLQIGKEKERLLEAAAAAEAAGQGTIWIVKPNGLNRGTGISVVPGIGNFHFATRASIPYPKCEIYYGENLRKNLSQICACFLFFNISF
jgi:hypothetical protein